MRILLVSDLHYRLPQFDWVVCVAPSFDLVVLAGDHLDISSAVSLDAQSVVILQYLLLLRSAGDVAVSSGNHDLTGPDGQGEQAALWLSDARLAGVPTDGDSLLLGDTLVTICPWWDGPAGRAALETQLAADAARRPARWVWVYHWPPLALVYISGAFELGLGLALLAPPLRRWAAWGLIALFIAVFPANVNMAIHHLPFGEKPTPPALLWARLPLQLVFIYWAWHFARCRPTA